MFFDKKGFKPILGIVNMALPLGACPPKSDSVVGLNSVFGVAASFSKLICVNHFVLLCAITIYFILATVVL